MRICIYGAGAVGGVLGARLARAAAETGDEISLIARGAHLAAMRDKGLTLRAPDETFTVPVNATDDPASLGPQDHVIVTLKAQSVTAALPGIQALLGPETTVTMAVNGLPWWYFHALKGPWEGRRVQASDPGGRIWDGIGPERALGCVVYVPAESPEPGVVVQANRFLLQMGEPDGTRSPRLKAIAAAIEAGGVKVDLPPDIRTRVWSKLWGNLSFNPVAALTGASLDRLCADAGACAVIREMMVEGQAVGEKLGIEFPDDLDKRIAESGRVGAHKPSMLQDLERGREMEIGPIVASVEELGALVGAPTPTIAMVRALLELRGKTAAMQGGA